MSVGNADRVAAIKDNGGVTTTATIVSIDSRRASSSDPRPKIIYTPEYEYVDEAGTTHMIDGSEEKTRQSSPSFQIGDTASVMYDPEDPSNAFLEGQGESSPLTTYFPLVFCVVGLGLAIFDLMNSTKARREEE